MLWIFCAYACKISKKAVVILKRTVFLSVSLSLSPSRPKVEGLPPNGESRQYDCYSTCLSFLCTVRRPKVYGQPQTLPVERSYDHLQPVLGCPVCIYRIWGENPEIFILRGGISMQIFLNLNKLVCLCRLRERRVIFYSLWRRHCVFELLLTTSSWR